MILLPDGSLVGSGSFFTRLGGRLVHVSYGMDDGIFSVTAIRAGQRQVKFSTVTYAQEKELERAAWIHAKETAEEESSFYQG